MADGTIRIDTKIDESGLDSSLKKVSGSLSSFAGLATSLFAGISVASFGKAALKSTADIELAQSKMETLLGSAEKSQYLISQIVKMADTTPYDSNTLIQAATTLKGFGVAAQDIMPTLTALGNASGGVAEQMSRVAVVFGQVKAQGKMMGNDFFQFINAGVPIVEVLAQGLHKSVSEIQALRESGGITFDMLNKAFATMYTGTGKWAGLMEKAAKTLPGMWSTLQDSSMAFGRSIVAVLEPSIKRVMTVTTDLFSVVAKFINELSPWTKDSIATFVEVAAAIGAITAAVYIARTAFFALQAVMIAVSAHPLLAIVTAVALITAALAEAIAKLTIFSDEFAELEAAQKDAAKAARNLADAVLKHAGALEEEMSSQKLTNAQIRERILFQEKVNKKLLASTAITDKQREGLKKMTTEIEALKKKYGLLDTAMAFPGSAGATNELRKRLDDQKALYDELRMYLITSGMTWRQKELTLLAAEYKKKLDMAQGNAEELLMIRKWYELEKENIEKANAMEGGAGGQALQYFFGVDPKKIKSSLDFFKKGLFATGVGWTLKDFGFTKAGEFILGFSKGLDAGTFVVTSVLKGLAKMCWIAFDTVWAILSKGFDILSWMSDFSPSEIYDSFKKFINGLSDFFTNDIGSLPVFFDMGVKVFEDFINGMIQNLPAIVETIGNVIDHIVTYFIENGPRLIEQIFTIIFSLFDKLTDKIPQIIDAVMTIVNAIIEKLPMIVDKLLNALVVALQSFGDNAEKFASTIVGAIAGILDSIANNIGPLLIAVVKIVVALVNGIIEKIPTLTASFDKLMLALVQALTDAFPVLLKGIIAAIPALITAIIESVTNSLNEHTGEKMIIAVVVGITKSIPGVVKALVIAIGKIFTESIPALFKGFYNIGKNVVLGIKKGFTDYAPRVWGAIKKFFTGLIDKVKGIFGIHSPSTVFADIGVDCIKGFINGVKSIAGTLKNLFGNVFSSVFSFLSGLVSTFASIGSTFASALVDGFKSIGGSLADVLVNVLQSAVTCLVFGLRDVVFGWIKEQVMSMIGTIADSVWPSIKSKVKHMLPGRGGGLFGKFASGTSYAPGGLALVGEQGPELVNLPRGSQVFTAAETKAMLSGKGYQSLVNGLSGGLSMSPALASSGVGWGGMTIRNIMTGTVQVDGRTLARIVYENFDKVHKAAYGN